MTGSLVTGVIGAGVALAILLLIRRDRLHVNHGLWWVAVATAFALLGFMPGVVDAVAARLGISYPPILALTAAIAALVLRLLIMDLERSRLEMRYERLIQRVAMLEADLARASAADRHGDTTGNESGRCNDHP